MSESRRPRRWPWVLSVLGVLLVIAGWWINRQLEPDRLTATVLQKAGESLQLNLRFEGQPEYALKPEPRLLIPNLSVSGADGRVFLSAKRAEISLPWSTLTGDEPVITRVELDQPVLALPGLRRWLATRPEAPFELPTLNKGLAVSDGTVTDDGYAISKLGLDLPRLKTGEPASVEAQGRFAQGETTVDFQLELGAETPGLASDFTVQGSGQLLQQPEPLNFQLRSNGRYISDDAGFSVEARELKFDGASPLPNIAGKGKLAVSEQTRLDFDGLLLDWPKTWPALPTPLAADSKNLPVRISYAGKPDFSDPVSLLVTREPTTLQASLRVGDLQQWLAATNGSPLPPINGTLSTPSLEFDGVKLLGVEVEISDGNASAAPP